MILIYDKFYIIIIIFLMLFPDLILSHFMVEGFVSLNFQIPVLYNIKYRFVVILSLNFLKL